MSVTSSPTEPDIHIKTLSPVSPKPLHYPSPSNIPILEKQMDPTFSDSLAHDFSLGRIQPQSGSGQPDTTAQPSAEGMEASTAGLDMTGGGASQGAIASTGASDLNIPSDLNMSHEVTAAQSAQIPGLPLGETPSTAYHADPSATALPFGSAQSNLTAMVPQEYNPANPAAAASIPNPQVSSGDTVDFDDLLASLTKSPIANLTGSQMEAHSTITQTNVQGDSASGADGNNHNLPPRPPPQEKPAMHPNYAQSDDLRAYHPHNQMNPPHSYGGPSMLPNVITSSNGTPGQPAPPLPQPPGSATYPMHSPATPTFPQQQPVEARVNSGDRWDAEVQRKYDEFLTNERMYDQDRNWAKFPDGSRLFVGNLPTELVSKRDLFQRFHKYGLIVQISIKKAFGFVQYMDQEACRRAMAAEQGNVIQGRKINLEISRPQQDRGQQSSGRDSRRRSRSPARNRGQHDRYRDRPISPRSRDRHYRPGRSPSPRGYRGGRRDRSPGRDHYDGRRRSRSPPGRYAGGNSPRRLEENDGLPFPRRHPADVPDVQIVVLDNLERNFVTYIESQFKQKALRTDVLYLPPGIPQEAVIKRQALEGVLAVVNLGREAMSTFSISVMLFDRSQGSGNVRFEVYDRIKPEDAPQFVTRQKYSQQPVGTPVVGMQPHQPWGAPPPQAQQYAPGPGARHYDGQVPSQPPPQSASVIGNTDVNSLLATINSNPELQRLVAQAQQKSAPGFPQQQPSVGGQTDFGNLLHPVQQPPGQQQTPYGHPHQSQGTPAGQQNSLAALSALLNTVGGHPAQASPTTPGAPLGQGQSMQQQPGSAQPDMAELMAQLAQYNGRK